MTTHPLLRLSLLSLALAGLSACDKAPQPEAKAAKQQSKAEQHQVHGDGINWFQGGVDAAFVQAKADGKPVFLFWGAEWCPYCQQIKNTIFNRREFIEQSRQFVAVYVDGDAEGAQAIGDRFKVMGYPTMLVFAPDGTELTRLPGGIDLEQYAAVLDRSLNGLKPVQDLARAALAGQALSDSEYRQLAYYSWDQDGDIDNRAALFASLGEGAGQADVRTRFYLLWVGEQLQGDGLAADQGAELARQLGAILADGALTKAALEWLQYLPGELLEATGLEGEAKEKLQAKWLAAMDQVAADAGYSNRERLLAAYPALAFADQPDEGLQAQVRKAVARADADTSNPYERQAVMSAAISLLRDADLNEEASSLAETELKKAAQPHYFMSYIASIEEELGNGDQALAWRKRAFDEARGPATRFQWGTSYLQALVRLAPEQGQLIEQTALALLDEVQQSELFSGRNYKRLQRIEQSLRDWQGDSQAIKSKVLGQCQPLAQALKARCEAFMAAEA
ncbi:thioredoxin family protein [Gallaecimonas sp. GXIMD4217]|uniref:thioredoxin family protein n=1 Tax=Gallaecimonas sp. GXIMD4217 TaxID=3131927 RepID=UPI00311B1378